MTPLTRSKTACVPQKHPPAKTAVARPGDVASGTSAVGGTMGPCSRDSALQATVRRERVTAKAALITERRRMNLVSHFAMRGVRMQCSGRVFCNGYAWVWMAAWTGCDGVGYRRGRNGCRSGIDAGCVK